ncbi:MAG: hypothetical protein R2713_18515 [Ilumatobacteraceae bacterium]|nr:hypothetical protein [Acidimicrobiales bacterium]MCB9394121.1 hypothetical protein [Acidimicrobiaceae bacterium]
MSTHAEGADAPAHTDDVARDALLVSLLARLDRQEARIGLLEAELAAARAAVVESAESVSGPSGTSRRRLILGAAGATAAAVAGSRALPAAADANVVETTQYGVYASPDNVATPLLPAAARVGVAGLADTSAPTPSDTTKAGVFGGSDKGHGVVGRSSAGLAGVLGSGTGAVIGVHGQSTTGVGVRAESASGAGVQATSTAGRAVVGVSTNDVGGEFSGKVGALLLSSAAVPPPQRGHAAVQGAIDVDTNGDLWYCVQGGSPSAWRKLAGPSTAGSFHPVTPGRVYDSRLVEPAGAVGPLASGQARTISVSGRRDLTTGVVDLVDFVPSGARAITANVGVVETVGSGFVAINPGGNAGIAAASINWFATGQILNNGQNLTLDANRQLTIVCGGGGSTHVIVDVTGYFL